MTKMAKVIAMKMKLSCSMRHMASVSPGARNCGRKARKKIDSFGFSRLSKMPEKITAPFERGVLCGSICNAPWLWSVLHAIHNR
ncbi:hypothetical protein D3C84_922320 [compost metagenome]